jgi:hypothetical protein
MSRVVWLLAVVAVCAPLALAQQPNSPTARMMWNFQEGPPFPIVGVPLSTGTTA